jgi:hypothetical protein
MVTDIASDIIAAFEKARAGSKRVRFTFLSRAFNEVQYLLGMEKEGSVRLKPGDAVTLRTVFMTRDWERDGDRRIEVILTPTSDAEAFVRRMELGCESAVAVS